MKKLFLFILFLMSVSMTFAQTSSPPFWNDIQKFKRLDSIAFPVKDQILFIGSSSFTLWKDVQEYFPEYKILNRAFGGSTLSDQIFYFNDIAPVYKPKQIVIYCGENDFAASDTISVSTVVQRFKTLFRLIRKHQRNVSIAYVSMKPSPSRVRLMSKYDAANNEIKNFLITKKRAAFIDVYHLMLNTEGKPKPEIFLNDNLHMNKRGYTIWQNAILPYLKK